MAISVENPTEAGQRGYLVLVSFVASLGGFLFGFDTAVISGAIGYMRTQFELGPIMEGWVVSSALIGCIAGALIAGGASDYWPHQRDLHFCRHRCR